MEIPLINKSTLHFIRKKRKREWNEFECVLFTFFLHISTKFVAFNQESHRHGIFSRQNWHILLFLAMEISLFYLFLKHFTARVCMLNQLICVFDFRNQSFSPRFRKVSILEPHQFNWVIGKEHAIWPLKSIFNFLSSKSKNE